jgi:stage V sporulation protein AC
MPEEGVESVAHNDILKFDETLRICRVLAKNGLKNVKITGGEPLVRRGAANLIKQIKDIDGIESVTITTNGVLLTEQYHNLVGAGADSITVSLDTLDREKYAQLTRRDELERVLKGIALAQKENMVRLKINVVPVYGLDEKEGRSVAMICVIVITAVLTGFGVFDNIAKHAGAGTMVPISGFANSVVAPALEFKAEGTITGTAAQMFSIAGPVIVFGCSGAAVYGLIYYILM